MSTKKLDAQQKQRVEISVGNGVTVCGSLYAAGKYVVAHNKAETLRKEVSGIAKRIRPYGEVDAAIADELEIALRGGA